MNLLSMLQREEEDSREWDRKERVKTPPRNPARAIKPPEYRLVVGLQKKTRSWDFMPSSITKVRSTFECIIGLVLTSFVSHMPLRQSVT